jgi:hypothetical protein
VLTVAKDRADLHADCSRFTFGPTILHVRQAARAAIASVVKRSSRRGQGLVLIDREACMMTVFDAPQLEES